MVQQRRNDAGKDLLKAAVHPTNPDNPSTRQLLSGQAQLLVEVILS
jgi:hypothetical protein